MWKQIIYNKNRLKLSFRKSQVRKVTGEKLLPHECFCPGLKQVSWHQVQSYWKFVREMANSLIKAERLSKISGMISFDYKYTILWYSMECHLGSDNCRAQSAVVTQWSATWLAHSSDEEVGLELKY